MVWMSTVKVPTFSGLEPDEKNKKQIAALATVLRKAAYDWALTQAVNETPATAGVIGAAFYAAVWDLSESLSPEKQTAMRFACYATLISNDELSVALDKTSSQLPN